MQIRSVEPTDLSALIEIDGTIDSGSYLHVERSGEGMAIAWKIEERPLRTKVSDRNRPTDDSQFLLKQIVTGAEEGRALLAEHDGAMIGLIVAQAQPAFGTMRLIDLRIDFDYRRQGLASGMVYQLISEAREQELRAVSAETRANNFPANQLFQKLGFDLTGLDTHRHSNHDLVKESATMFWYAALK